MPNVYNATPTLNLSQLLQEILVAHVMVNIAAYAFFDQRLWWWVVECFLTIQMESGCFD